MRLVKSVCYCASEVNVGSNLIVFEQHALGNCRVLYNVHGKKMSGLLKHHILKEQCNYGDMVTKICSPVIICRRDQKMNEWIRQPTICSWCHDTNCVVKVEFPAKMTVELWTKTIMSSTTKTMDQKH